MQKNKKQTSAKTFLTIPEVQGYLGIKSRKTILKYIRNGRLQAYKIGGTRWRVDLDDVHAFLKSELIAISKDTPQKKESSSTVTP